MEPKGHHERGYLPHRDYGGALQAVTFREKDSLPARVIERWKVELEDLLLNEDMREQAEKELRQRIARYEDAGYGRCCLRHESAARIVQDELLAGHGSAYLLIAWCVMPNHVHVLIRQEPSRSLGAVLKNWKGRSARRINQQLRRSGALWARDYFDRAIRDSDHFWRSIRYIHRNPVKAGLVKTPEDWAFSSAGYGWPMPEA